MQSVPSGHLAHISPFTDACASGASEVCSVDAFERVNMQWITRLHALGVPVVFQGLYQFLEPKLYNCGAIGPNGYTSNPNGEIHKCGLAVDDPSEGWEAVSTQEPGRGCMQKERDAPQGIPFSLNTRRFDAVEMH